MTSMFHAGLLASLLLSTAAFAESPSVSDAEFVKMASVGNTFEIEEARLAEQRATDPRLKSFAQRMVAEHSTAMKDLQGSAGQDGDKATMMLDKPHQAMLDNLKTFNGTDFDKIYIADQVASHAETVALLSDYKVNGKTSSLMSWTNKSLPIVKQHQADINSM